MPTIISRKIKRERWAHPNKQKNTDYLKVNLRNVLKRKEKRTRKRNVYTMSKEKCRG